MTDFTHHTPRLLSDADAAADLAGVPRPNDLPSVGTKDARPVKVPPQALFNLNREAALSLANDIEADGCCAHRKETINLLRDLVSERDELASRVMELEGALWGCIAAIERTHHCTEADRLAAADKARAAISAKKGGQP